MFKPTASHIRTLSLILIGFLLLDCLVWAEHPFPKPSGSVNDFANVIPPAYAQKIQAITLELYEKTHIPVVVATMPDIGEYDYNDYANRLYEAWGIGEKGKDNGVLIFVTVKERKMRIETGYGVEGILPDGLCGEIRDQYMIPYLKENNYGEGLLSGTMAVAQVIARHSGVKLTGQMPLKPDSRKSSGLSFLPLILILLVIFSLRRRGGSWLLLPLFLGGGGSRSSSRGIGAGFAGFTGGFRGFGGGMSGGGGAGGSF